MAKRFHDTQIWTQDWFNNLPTEYALFYLYIKDNCDHAGIWKPNKKMFEAIAGKPIDYATALKHFNAEKKRIRVLKNERWYLEGFIYFQYGSDINKNSALHRSIIAELKNNGIDLKSVEGVKIEH